MGSSARHKCACQVWNTQAHQGTCLVQLQKACMLFLYAFVACLGAVERKEKKRKDHAFWRQFHEKPSIIPGCPELGRHMCLSCADMQSLQISMRMLLVCGVFYGMDLWSSRLLRHDSRSVAATFQSR